MLALSLFVHGQWYLAGCTRSTRTKSLRTGREAMPLPRPFTSDAGTSWTLLAAMTPGFHSQLNDVSLTSWRRDWEHKIQLCEHKTFKVWLWFWSISWAVCVMLYASTKRQTCMNADDWCFFLNMSWKTMYLCTTNEKESRVSMYKLVFSRTLEKKKSSQENQNYIFWAELCLTGLKNTTTEKSV